MSLRTYLITMTLATLIAVGAFVYVLYVIDPDRAGFFGFLLFSFTLFLVLFGIFSIVGFVIRFFFRRSVLLYQHVTIAFRQAAWYAVLVVGMLWLQTTGLLTWWNALLFVIGLTLIEFAALSLRRQPPT